MPVQSAETEKCKVPKLSDVGWTDITATTALASLLLEKSGYQPETIMLSVPVTLQSLTRGQIDIFVGNWMPLQGDMRKPYLEKKQIEQLVVNLDSAKIGLAVAGRNLGIKQYAYIAKFKDELGGKIYGIEVGSSANATLQAMIEANSFALQDFQLVESSEQAMLSQVQSAIRRDQPILFFAWTPHPMNINYQLTFLENSQDLLGPNDGAASVETLTRKDYAAQCPNVAKFLTNLKFTTQMESELMNMIINDKIDPKKAAQNWIKNNPQQLNIWFDGVTTFEGEPALPVVKMALDL